MKIWNFVITGGPCAGKTSALNLLKNNLELKGYKVIIVPETATEVISSGIKCNEFPKKDYQKVILSRSLNKENTTREISKLCNTDVVIFYDRGILDGKAYISDEEFEELLEENNITEEKILERYDAIFHLVSTACGNENEYTLENNNARTETIEEARKLDERTRKVWEKHINLKIINNYKEFDKKMNKLLEELYKIMNF